jgi:hypothetical protein
MSFDASLRDAWTNGFHPAIREAGFSPLRLDDKESVASPMKSYRKSAAHALWWRTTRAR